MRREFLAASLKQSKTEGRVRDLVWYSGVDVRRVDLWTGQEWTLRMPMERARIDRLNAGAPLLKNHSFARPVENQVGVIERAWIEDGVGLATVRFADTPDVADIWRKVEDGIIQNVSMEAVIDDYEDVTPKGQKQKVLAATGWEVEAIALVPVGADPSAGFLSAVPAFQSLAQAAKVPDRRIRAEVARLSLL